MVRADQTRGAVSLLHGLAREREATKGAGKFMTRSLLLFLPLLLAGCGPAGEPSLAVTDAWARESGSTSTAAYLTIANSGEEGDRLTSVTLPHGGSASLHETLFDEGVARMAPAPKGFAVEPGQVLALRPGGRHVMLSGLPTPADAGSTVPLTLQFERSGEQRIDLPVRSARNGSQR